MKKVNIILAILLFNTILISCAYRWEKNTTQDGETILVKTYKDRERHQRYVENNLFYLKPEQQNLKKYEGVIRVDTTQVYTFFEFDTLRIYLKTSEASKYESLFSTGKLHNKIFYCARNPSCKPNSSSLIYNYYTGEKFKPQFANWSGESIRIATIEESEHLKVSPQKRRFKIRANSTGYVGYEVYFMELTNENVTTYVPVDKFIENARLSFFMSPWSEI